MSSEQDQSIVRTLPGRCQILTLFLDEERHDGLCTSKAGRGCLPAWRPTANRSQRLRIKSWALRLAFLVLVCSCCQRFCEAQEGADLRLVLPTEESQENTRKSPESTEAADANSGVGPADADQPPSSVEAESGQASSREPNQPADSVTVSSREMLEQFGVYDSYWYYLDDSEPLDQGESEVLHAFFSAVRRFTPMDQHRRTQPGRVLADAMADPAAHRGVIVPIQGRVTKVSRIKTDPAVALRFGLPAYFRCQFEATQPNSPFQRATIYSLVVPENWQRHNLPPRGEWRTSAVGFFLKTAGENHPVLVTQRMAWHPPGLLGDLQMDVGLFDQLKPRSRRPQRNPFYELLAATSRVRQGYFLETCRIDQDAVDLQAKHVRDWAVFPWFLAVAADSPDPSPGRQLWALLPADLRSGLQSAGPDQRLDDALVEQLLNAINDRVLTNPHFYSTEAFQGVFLGLETRNQIQKALRQLGSKTALEFSQRVANLWKRAQAATSLAASMDQALRLQEAADKAAKVAVDKSASGQPQTNNPAPNSSATTDAQASRSQQKVSQALQTLTQRVAKLPQVNSRGDPLLAALQEAKSASQQATQALAAGNLDRATAQQQEVQRALRIAQRIAADEAKKVSAEGSSRKYAGRLPADAVLSRLVAEGLATLPTAQLKALNRVLLEEAFPNDIRRSRPHSVVPLFNDPKNQAGRLVMLRGIARRASRIEVTDPEIVSRLGIRHYYEVWLYTEDSLNNPLVVCVRSLPEKMPQGQDIYEVVEIPCFFLQAWSYESAKSEAQRQELAARRLETIEEGEFLPEDLQSAGQIRLQSAPMLLGQELIWLKDATQPPATGVYAYYAAALLVVAAGGFCLWVWYLHREDARFRSRNLTPRYEPTGNTSLNDLGLEATAEPDFSHLNQQTQSLDSSPEADEYDNRKPE